MASVADRRVGRPPKLDDDGVATRDRLLRAAVASCVEFGFDGATVVDIAARADVSAPAIYNHFGGKVELLVAAARWELTGLAPRDTSMAWAAPDVVRAFLSPEFRSTRRLLAEIHVAAARHPEVAALLDEWHAEQAARWVSTSGMDDDAVVKTFFALLLGLCQVESLAALPARPSSLEQCAVTLATVLYP